MALFDHAPTVLGAFDPSDTRKRTLEVAGPSALAIAKLAKIRERIESGREDRILPKDAGDLLRLLRMCDAKGIGVRLAQLGTAPRLHGVIDPLLTWAAQDIAGRRQSHLLGLGVLAAQGSEPDRQLESSMRTLLEQLIDAYKAGGRE